MTKQTQTILSAVVVFLVLAAALVAVTSGPLRSAPAEDHGHDDDPAHAETTPCCPGDAALEAHAQDEDDHAGHDHPLVAPGTTNLEAAMTASCEHDMRTIDCGECRYEVGAACIDPNLERALVVVQTVSAAEQSPRRLVLTGEIELDLTRMVQVTGIGAGRVQRIDRYLGEEVRAGDILAVLQSAELAQTQAQYIETVAQRDLTEQTFRREEQLQKQQVTSQADYQAARAAWESAQVMVRAAEHRLRLFGMSDGDIQTLAATRACATVGELTLRAPRNGTIIEQAVVLGQFVEAGRTLYTLADLAEVWLWCHVYERDLQSLYTAKGEQASLQVTVQVPAYADTAFSGTLDLIDPRMDHTTRTVKVRVRVTNPQDRLKPGMFAQATLDLTGTGPAIRVPASAVLADEGQPFVFVRLQDDLWLRRNVKIGTTHDGLTEILDGLHEGQTFAAQGAFMFKSEVLKEKMGAGCAH